MIIWALIAVAFVAALALFLSGAPDALELDRIVMNKGKGNSNASG